VLKFNASDLSKKPSQVFAAAREDGAIIQHKDRQSKVVEEFVIVNKDTYRGIEKLALDKLADIAVDELLKGDL